jgi:predicted enzyme related to lactoylglutathione lyase
MNPVVHFEMPAENKERMISFYEKTFDWQVQRLGPEMGNYVVVMTTESDANGPKTPGVINGGFYDKTPDMPNAAPSIVIAVGDVRAAMQRIADAGGRVLGEPVDIPGVGAYVSFLDTEGNRASILQPLPRG